MLPAPVLDRPEITLADQVGDQCPELLADLAIARRIAGEQAAPLGQQVLAVALAIPLGQIVRPRDGRQGLDRRVHRIDDPHATAGWLGDLPHIDGYQRRLVGEHGLNRVAKVRLQPLPIRLVRLRRKQPTARSSIRLTYRRAA